MSEAIIQFFSDNISFELPKKREHIRWLMDLVKNEGQSIQEINCIFMSDDALLEINKTHLDHDYYTDIITFDYSTEEGLQGELYISLDRVKDNAQRMGEVFDNELDRVICHGFLHLLGYNDKTENEREEIRGKEDYYLNLRPFVSRGT